MGKINFLPVQRYISKSVKNNAIDKYLGLKNRTNLDEVPKHSISVIVDVISCPNISLGVAPLALTMNRFIL